MMIEDEGGPAVTTRDGPPILAGVIVGNLGRESSAKSFPVVA